MSTLAEFLLNASPDRNQAVAEAHNHPVIVGRLIEATTMNSVASELDLSADIKRIAESQDHIARHKMSSVYMGLTGNHLFNFIAGTYAGDKAIAQLDWLIDVGFANEPVLAAKLSILQAHVMQLANVITYPLINTTLHDVLVTLNECPTAPVTKSGAFAVINSTAACPLHKPRLMVKSPNTQQWRRVNNFDKVSAAGTYECLIPADVRSWELAVDDAYGVL